MASFKILYGIDLGTTNSAIVRMEDGVPVVKKNTMQTDTTPSCVGFPRQDRVIVGTRALNNLGMDLINAFKRSGYQIKTFVEFKRMMGTDHKYVAWQTAHTPEELSAEVLKDLRKNILDESVTAAVITVPAMFTNTQKAATMKAAELAGFEHVELIQEPVAASIAYGLRNRVGNSHWLVFDFGGGTFDAALMRMEGGVMQSVDTAGDNKLGGKDIDTAIIDELIMPYLKSNYSLTETIANRGTGFREMWRPIAESVKINLSRQEREEIDTDLGQDYGTDDNGEELAISMTITREDLERVAKPIFQKAIDISKQLLERNGLTGADLGTIILVGGPTHSPIVREMIRQQLSANIDTSVDPMTCVAVGAAIYGSTLDMPQDVVDRHRDTSKVQLDVVCQSTSVGDEEYATIKLLKDRSEYLYQFVNVELSRADGMFTSPQTRIDIHGDVITLPLVEGKANSFRINCFDPTGNRVECEPSEISIVQGVSIEGAASNPMAIGIGTLNAAHIEVFDLIPGLEKKHKLPTTGVLRGRRTVKDMHPGNSQDEIRMSLYQLDEVAKDVRVLYCNEHIGDATLNGYDLPQLVPAGSEVIVKVSLDQSGMVSNFEIEIPAIRFTLDLTDRIKQTRNSAPARSFIMQELNDASQRAMAVGRNDLYARVNVVKQRYSANPGDADLAEATLTELKQICRELDKV